MIDTTSIKTLQFCEIQVLYFDVPATMKILKVSRSTVFRMIKRGELESVNFLGRRLISRESISEYLIKRNTGG